MSADSPLITPVELAGRLGEPGLTILDATSTWPGGPEAKLEGAIPGAVRFDIDHVCDQDADLPHMLPSLTDFAAHARGMGVTRESSIVVYDRMGVVGAPRGWWMFKVMGATEVRVLDGGLPSWAAAGGALVDAPAKLAPVFGDFVVSFDGRMLADCDRVGHALATGEAQVLDVRSRARFLGEAAEPRPGLRAGHMPGAFNLPWTDLIADDGRLKSAEELRAAFERADLDLGRPVITSCGSGVTACIAALALERIGCFAWAVYDGSWAEWGAREDCAVVQGRAVSA